MAGTLELSRALILRDTLVSHPGAPNPPAALRGRARPRCYYYRRRRPSYEPCAYARRRAPTSRRTDDEKLEQVCLLFGGADASAARGAARRRGAFTTIAAAGRRSRAALDCAGVPRDVAGSSRRGAGAGSSRAWVFLRLGLCVFGSLRFDCAGVADALSDSRDSRPPPGAPPARASFRVLERRHGLAEIVECAGSL